MLCYTQDDASAEGGMYRFEIDSFNVYYTLKYIYWYIKLTNYYYTIDLGFFSMCFLFSILTEKIILDP